MKLHTIYRIYCIETQKCYVGVTHHFRTRKHQHLSLLKKGRHHSSKLQAVYIVHGKESIRFQVLEKGLKRKIAYEREQSWIAFYNSHIDGYNMTEGGENSLGIKNSSIHCEWNGIKYNSISDAAKAVGICNSAMSVRLRKGYICDNDMQRNAPVQWNGKTYRNIQSLADELGLTFTAVFNRLNVGYTCDADMKTASNLRIPCVWNGIEYPSMNKAAIANDVAPQKMFRWVKAGYTRDEDTPRYKKAS